MSLTLHGSLLWLLGTTHTPHLPYADTQASVSILFTDAPPRGHEPPSLAPTEPPTEPPRAAGLTPPSATLPEQPRVAEHVPQPITEVVPGIDDSSAHTEAWQGFAQATPQQAPKFEIDQPALSPLPGSNTPTHQPSPPQLTTPATPIEPSPNQPSPSTPSIAPPEALAPPSPSPTVANPPSPQPASDSSDSSPSDSATRTQPIDAPQAPSSALPIQPISTQSPPESPPARASSDNPSQPSSVPTTPASMPEPPPAPEEPPPQPVGDDLPTSPHAPESASARESREPSPATQPLSPSPLDLLVQGVPLTFAPASSQAPTASASPTNAPAASGQSLGELSESESSPTSADITLDSAHLGRTLARAGLQITTVRPRWSHTTQLTTDPNDAFVKVHFARDGRVRRVELLQSTGHALVDDPLLTALYRWRARGTQLQTLPASNPDATLSMSFRISFR